MQCSKLPQHSKVWRRDPTAQRAQHGRCSQPTFLNVRLVRKSSSAIIPRPVRSTSLLASLLSPLPPLLSLKQSILRHCLSDRGERYCAAAFKAHLTSHTRACTAFPPLALPRLRLIRRCRCCCLARPVPASRLRYRRPGHDVCVAHVGGTALEHAHRLVVQAVQRLGVHPRHRAS